MSAPKSAASAAQKGKMGKMGKMGKKARVSYKSAVLQEISL